MIFYTHSNPMPLVSHTSLLNPTHYYGATVYIGTTATRKNSYLYRVVHFYHARQSAPPLSTPTRNHMLTPLFIVHLILINSPPPPTMNYILTPPHPLHLTPPLRTIYSTPSITLNTPSNSPIYLLYERYQLHL